MAHLKHGEHGTTVEVDDKAAKGMAVDGWEVVGDDDRHDSGRRKSTRKAAS